MDVNNISLNAGYRYPLGFYSFVEREKFDERGIFKYRHRYTAYRSIGLIYGYFQHGNQFGIKMNSFNLFEILRGGTGSGVVLCPGLEAGTSTVPETRGLYLRPGLDLKFFDLRLWCKESYTFLKLGITYQRNIGTSERKGNNILGLYLGLALNVKRGKPVRSDNYSGGGWNF